MNHRAKVLVAEKIGDPGVELLREHFDVDLGAGWSREELAERIGGYDGLLIRSATKLDGELIDKAQRLRAVGRAGVGVDNVDVAATKRGIVVATRHSQRDDGGRAHDGAVAGARSQRPTGHASYTSGKWGRSKFSGVGCPRRRSGTGASGASGSSSHTGRSPSACT